VARAVYGRRGGNLSYRYSTAELRCAARVSLSDAGVGFMLLPQPRSSSEVMHYGVAVDVTPGRVRPVPEKRCKRCGGPLEVVERGGRGLDPREQVVWEPLLLRCPNGCLPRHVGNEHPRK
jgi:hypothetical protein